MASWEWNVECCVCRAPFPASLTAQTHANDQYYWGTIDGLATKQEKLITTKALLSFNYWSSVAISEPHKDTGPTLILNLKKKNEQMKKKNVMRMKKNRWRWKVDKIICLSVWAGGKEGWFWGRGWENKRSAEDCADFNWKNCHQKNDSTRYLRDLGRLHFL